MAPEEAWKIIKKRFATDIISETDPMLLDVYVDSYVALNQMFQPEINLYDEEEIHENCTVQILRNSVTGKISVGWWENE